MNFFELTSVIYFVIIYYQRKIKELPVKIERLYEKAKLLPKKPGIYIMKDKSGKVIYVGKSKSLQNRVSQYFTQVESHPIKTRKMVMSADDFECLFTDTENEALVLENEFIKKYKPRYNIKLKDDRRYPYLKVEMGAYPRLCMVRSRSNVKHDTAKYFGPYSSSSTVYNLIDTVQKTFKTATCKKKFPEDIGKGRPCLNYHIDRCIGPCTGKISQEEYRAIFDKILLFLKGDTKEAADNVKHEMLKASDELNFERAAKLRDIYLSLEKLSQNQKIIASPETDQDVFGIYSDDISACIAVLFIRGGKLADMDSFIFDADEIPDASSFSAFLIEFYKKREYVPRQIIIAHSLMWDCEPERRYLTLQSGYNVKFVFPERGELKKLNDMACENARSIALHSREVNQKSDSLLTELAQLLKLEVVPERIEAYDISNTGDTHITCGMIVIENGAFKKRDYRSFNIKSESQDDYAAMTEALSRRISHAEDDSFPPLPDLILLDGGKGHVSTIKELFGRMNIEIPVFGMVKDSFHKTRSLTDEYNEISIAKNITIFNFICKIQEEVHRFSFSKMDARRSKGMVSSRLEKIDGIGEVKAKKLMKHFKSIKAVSMASEQELTAVDGITKKDAANITAFFEK